ncbi:hypothetical protein LWC33_33880 [Pseudonocardia sp. RS11V-5]|uniref:hypothetical protein n=1 Tax=Pseudonocardia terrae TaxID=2905831 RepID=UPI001E2A5F75|nr:hypothetical protein [Pseudonocardia terrae]MCE3556417.1 hypothetical protein [Pseudonocardia terrae]
MPRSVPRLLRRVRNERARLNEADNQASVPVTVDLSALPVLGPAVCAQLLLLIGLLREVAAPGQVALVGVASTLRSCLAAGLPDGVRLVDRRGRVWGR